MKLLLLFVMLFSIGSCTSNPFKKARANVIRVNNINNPELLPFEKVAKQYLGPAEDKFIEDSYILQIFAAIPNAKVQNINQFFLASLSESNSEPSNREYKLLCQGPCKNFLDTETTQLHDFSFWSTGESNALLIDIEHKKSNYNEITVSNRSISLNDVSLEKTNFDLRKSKEASAFNKLKKSLPPKDSQIAYYCKLFKKSGYQCTLSKGIAPESSQN